MSIDAVPLRRRRSPEAARADAVAAARTILIGSGPAAVTLKAVAAALGMTHANLLHHFGSAAGLQSALMASMVGDLATALGSAVEAMRDGEAEPGAPVDIVFEAFETGGAARLAAWLALTDETRQMEPIREQLASLVVTLEGQLAGLGLDVGDRVRRAVLLVTSLAFADALIGDPLRDMLGLSRQEAVKMTKDAVLNILALPPRPPVA